MSIRKPLKKGQPGATAIVYEYINISYEGYLNIFTDGSKSQSGAAGAFYISACNHGANSLGKNLSSFTAELVGILLAIECMGERKCS